MSSDPFLAQLSALCREAKAGATWVVVPSHAVGRAIGERLALEGVDWVNLRFVTPFSLALGTAAPHLLAQRLDPLPEGLGPSLVMRLLLERRDDAPAYFRPLADQPRMGAALWSTLRELRLAGIDAARLKSGETGSPFEDANKQAELSGLLEAYELELSSRRMADQADVFRAARAHAADASIKPDDLLIEAPGLNAAAALVRAFLDALPGRRVTAALPPEDAVPPAQLFHAAGREAEVEGVLRRILNATPPIPLDRVEVVAAAPDAGPLLWEKAQRLGIPITVERGIPATATRPARALLALCLWIDSGFVAGPLRRLLQSGDIAIEFPDGAGGGRAAGLLAKADATRGRGTYRQALAALAARSRAAADSEETDSDEAREYYRRRAADAEFLAEWIRGLLEHVPVPDQQGRVALSEVVDGFLSVAEGRLTTGSALDGAAAGAMPEALRGLKALGAFRCPMRQALTFVRDAVERLAVGGSRARPGHLHVSTLATAGYAGRPFTFVVGLDEGAVFPELIEDPVLLDAERRAISEALPTSRDRLTETVRAARARLAVLPAPANEAEGGLWFSYSCRDLRDGRETAPSWLMLQALRSRTGKPDLTYKELQEHLGPAPETLVPRDAGHALTDAAWWVARLKAAGDAGLDAVLKAFPSLADGRVAADSRESDDFTEWDGRVPAAGPELDPRATGKPVSVTRLEGFARCPFRYFLEHGLGLEAAPAEPDRDQWLDPMQKGLLLHAVFATLGREARSRKKRLTAARDASRAHELVEAQLAGLRDNCPPPSEVVYDHERADLLRDVGLFLEFEEGRHAQRHSEPVAFELAFGQKAGGEEGLAQEEPVGIPLGGGGSFLLRGTIDRVDRLPDGSYEVIDYKTGSFKPAKWKGTFGGGAMLQHALYGVAATTLLRRWEAKPRVARGAYEFPSARGRGERVEIDPPSRSTLTAVLSDLLDTIAAGAFVATEHEETCTRCDFARACGKPLALAGRKLKNGGNTVLDAFRRLVAHE